MEADEYVYLYYDCIGEQIGEWVDHERDEVYTEWSDCPTTKVQYFKPVSITLWADYDTETPHLVIEESALYESEPLIHDRLVEPVLHEMVKAFDEMDALDAHDWLVGWRSDSERRRWSYTMGGGREVSVDFELESEEVNY